jgi:transposase
MINSEIRVETIDHLGIVAGLVDEIGIVEMLNKRLGIDPREKVTTGVIIKAMILNGLGFVSAPCICSANSFNNSSDSFKP